MELGQCHSPVGVTGNFWCHSPSVWLFLHNQVVFYFLQHLQSMLGFFSWSQKYVLPLSHRQDCVFLSVFQLFWALWYNSVTTSFALVKNLYFFFFFKKLEECCSSSPPTTCLNEIALQQSSINNVPCPWSRKCIMLFCARKLTSLQSENCYIRDFIK